MAIREIAELKAMMPIGVLGGTTVAELHDVIDTLSERTTQDIAVKTANYTATISDNRRKIFFNSTTDVVLTLPNNLPVGWECLVCQIGVGKVTVSRNQGQIFSRSNMLSLAGIYSVGYILCVENTGADPKIVFTGDMSNSTVVVAPTTSDFLNVSSFSLSGGDGVTSVDTTAKTVTVSFGTAATTMLGSHPVDIGTRYRVSWTASGAADSLVSFGNVAGGATPSQYLLPYPGTDGANSYDFTAETANVYMGLRRTTAGTTIFSNLSIMKIDDVNWGDTGLVLSSGWTAMEAGVTINTTAHTLSFTGNNTVIRARNSCATQTGKLYRLTWKIVGGPVFVSIGTTLGGSQYKTAVIKNSAGTNVIEFVATTTTTHFQLHKADDTTAVVSDIALHHSVPTEYIDITAHGAVGDGVTDNRTAINAALTAARDTGKFVRIPAGTFAYRGVLECRKAKIRGVGAGSVMHMLDTTIDCTVRLSGYGSSIENVKITGKLSPRTSGHLKASVTVQDCYGFRIKNVYVQGSATGSATAGVPGIFVYGGLYGYIGYNTVWGTRADAIHMTTGKLIDNTGSIVCRHILVERNFVNYANDDGIAVVTYGSATQENCGSNVEARYNTILNQYHGRCMTMIGAYQCHYHDNHLDGGVADMAGFMIASESSYLSGEVRDCRINHNTIRDCGGPSVGHGAIHLFNSNYPTHNLLVGGITVEDNEIYMARKMAILLNGGTTAAGINGVTIANNRMYSPANGTIVLGDGTDAAPPQNVTQTNNQSLLAANYPGDMVPVAVGVGAFS